MPLIGAFQTTSSTLSSLFRNEFELAQAQSKDTEAENKVVCMSRKHSRQSSVTSVFFFSQSDICNDWFSMKWDKDVQT